MCGFICTTNDELGLRERGFTTHVLPKEFHVCPQASICFTDVLHNFFNWPQCWVRGTWWQAVIITCCWACCHIDKQAKVQVKCWTLKCYMENWKWEQYIFYLKTRRSVRFSKSFNFWKRTARYYWGSPKQHSTFCLKSWISAVHFEHLSSSQTVPRFSWPSTSKPMRIRYRKIIFWSCKSC